MSSINLRQHEILAIARQSGKVTVEGLALHFDVTPQTIRKDLNELCEQRMLTRTHGGALLSSGVENVAYEASSQLDRRLQPKTSGHHRHAPHWIGHQIQRTCINSEAEPLSHAETQPVQRRAILIAAEKENPYSEERRQGSSDGHQINLRCIGPGAMETSWLSEGATTIS